MSPDCRFISLFTADALDHCQVPFRQDYVFHLKTGKTQLAVRTPSGGVVNDHLNISVLAPDGRFITFETSAASLVKATPTPAMTFSCGT